MFLQHWRVLAPSQCMCVRSECLVRFHLFVFVYLPRHLSIEIHILHHNNSMYTYTLLLLLLLLKPLKQQKEEEEKQEQEHEFQEENVSNAICIGDMEMKA